LRAEFVVGLDAVGLGDGKIQSERALFDGGGKEFETASLGAIGLGDDEMDAVAGGDQLFERGDSEGRCAAENERQGHFVIG
jgi:hypothetical protein